MSDRDAINAIFKTVCALAEKLTGERLQFEMRLSDGRHVWLSTENSGIVHWAPIDAPSVQPERTASESQEEQQRRL